MPADRRHDWYYKWLFLGVSLVGSVSGSYVAVKTQLAELNVRVTTVEVKLKEIDDSKLDIKQHAEFSQGLTNQLSSINTQIGLIQQCLYDMKKSNEESRHYSRK